MPIHIRANKEDFAPTVLLVGDPARAVRISQMLADPTIVNSRGIEVDVIGIPAEADGGRHAETLVEAVDVFGRCGQEGNRQGSGQIAHCA